MAKRASSGDVEAFERLTDRYLKAVFNIVLRMLGDRGEARYVTRQVFLEVQESLTAPDSAHGFRNGIYRIAIRRSIARTQEPKRGSLGADSHGHVQRALMDLRPSARSVIVLRHFLGCSYRDIGQILEIDERTARARLFAARRQLAPLLTGGGGRAHRHVARRSGR